MLDPAQFASIFRSTPHEKAAQLIRLIISNVQPSIELLDTLIDAWLREVTPYQADDTNLIPFLKDRRATVRRSLRIYNLSMRIDKVEGLPVRTVNALVNTGFTFLWEVLEKTRKELLEIRNFGPKSLREVTDVADEMGLQIAMTFTDEDRKVLPTRVAPST